MCLAGTFQLQNPDGSIPVCYLVQEYTGLRAGKHISYYNVPDVFGGEEKDPDYVGVK